MIQLPIQELNNNESTSISEGYPGIPAVDLPQDTVNYNDENTAIESNTQIHAIVSQTIVALATPGQIINGDFETGSLSGWTLMNSNSNGTFVINNDNYDPPGPDGPLPPYSGSFSALSSQSGPGIRTIYQDVTLPVDATTATLHWADRIRNHATAFIDPTQEFRVEIMDTNNNVLTQLFSTNPGDPLISEWTERSASISTFAGRTIRIAFTEQDTSYYFNVHLDNIRIEPGVSPVPPIVYDVYFGKDPNTLELVSGDINESSCDPTPDPNETLNGNTMYYWQVVAKNDCNQTQGPVWSFTTVDRPPIANASPNQAVYAWIGGIAKVTLDANNSYDPDGDALTYLWKWSIDGNTYEANGVNPTIELPVGQYTIELVVNDGKEDSEPNQVVITVIEPIKSILCIVPKIINGRSNDQQIMAMLRLPAGIGRSQIDLKKKLLLYPGEIESSFQFVLPCGQRGVEQYYFLAYFDKSDLIDAVGKAGKVQLYVVGQLKTGQYFYGSDTVCIINPPPRKPNWHAWKWGWGWEFGWLQR